MINIKCLDSSAWIAYHFGKSVEMKEIVDNGKLLITSSLALFEIKKRLTKLNEDYSVILDFIKERSLIILPTISIVEKAAEFSSEKKLGAMDALIYATAVLQQAELITADNDFRGLNNVRIIKEK